MQIIKCVVCDTSKGGIYKQIKPPLVVEHAVCLEAGFYNNIGRVVGSFTKLSNGERS